MCEGVCMYAASMQVCARNVQHNKACKDANGKADTHAREGEEGKLQELALRSSEVDKKKRKNIKNHENTYSIPRWCSKRYRLSRCSDPARMVRQSVAFMVESSGSPKRKSDAKPVCGSLLSHASVFIPLFYFIFWGGMCVGGGIHASTTPHATCKRQSRHARKAGRGRERKGKRRSEATLISQKTLDSPKEPKHVQLQNRSKRQHCSRPKRRVLGYPSETLR